MEAKPKIEKLKKSLEESDKKLSHVYEKKDILIREIESLNLESSKRQSDLLKISSIEEKRDQIKYLEEKIQSTVSELNHLKKKKTILEKDFDKNSNIDHKVDTLRIEVQEASIRSKKNLSAEVAFKQREIDRMKISLKHVIKELGYVTSEKKELEKAISQKKKIFEKKKKQDEELSLKFEKLLLTREEIQKRIRDSEKEIFEKESVVLEFENRLNDTKVEKAKFLARAENLEMELLNFPDVVVIKGNRGVFENRLKKTQEILFKIGSVNLRSLEVYDSIKKEYDDIKEKVGILNTEKEGILKIIEQIDIKKKRVFIKTINSLNEIFSRNFSQLSIKGAVSLELENKIDPFHGGVGILVKTGKGKYFDVTSLSGGEQTIVALSLIFAIQEYSPYYFYVLDEIDAALDKRNSEKLGRLLRKHMEKGQYILITHNDEVITNATSLFGVTMNDGVSKIVSVKL